MMNFKFLQKKLHHRSLDVWQGHKCNSGILRNSHSQNQFCWKLFLLKRYCKNSVTDDFGEPFRIVTFQNSGQLLKISPEIIVMYCLPYVYVISFAHLWQNMSKVDKICVIIFWKMFPFGLAWVNKISHKNYHTLFMLNLMETKL